MTLVYTVFSIVIFVVIGLFIEHFRTPELDLKGCVIQLRKDIKIVIKSLFEKEEVRHEFERELSDSFRNILQEYCAAGLDIDIGNSFGNEKLPPFIEIFLVPNYKNDQETTITLLERLMIKFRRYCELWILPWLSFGTYSSTKNQVHFVIYYSEFEDDYKKLIFKYKQTTKIKSAEDFGYLKDDDLEKEIDHVDKGGV